MIRSLPVRETFSSPRRGMGERYERGNHPAKSLLAGGSGMILSVLALSFSGWLAICTSVLGIVLLTIISRSTTAVNCCLLAAMPYAIGSYIGAGLGVSFYPWPGLSGYEAAAVEQSVSLLFTASVGAFSGVSQYFQRTLQSAAILFHDVSRYSGLRNSFVVAQLAAVVVGLHDLSFVATNLGAIVSSTRHTFSSSLWVGNGPFGIVLALAISAVLVLAIISSPKSRAAFVVPFILLWVPTLLAGARNYFSVLIVAAFAVLFVRLTSLRYRLGLACILLIGFIGFLAVPTFWSDNPLVWLNEWILPNSLFLPLLYNHFTPEAIGVTDFWRQIALFLPSPLRPYDVHTYSEVFDALDVTGVGVGGNPWADFYLPVLFMRLIAFAVGTLSLFLLASLASRITPIIPVLTVGLMAFWGRSSYWNTAFLIIYLTIVVAAFVRPGTKTDGFNDYRA